MSQDMKTFWQDKHRQADVLYLSGNGEVTLDVLHCRDEFAKAVTMLNIGVGMGHFERFCHEQGKALDSLDIAPEALERAKPFTVRQFNDPEWPQEQKYDLVTELLVAQHIDDTTLCRHIRGAISALAPGGTYALQSPERYDISGARPDPNLPAMQSGSVCRSIGWIDQTVRQSGGIITRVFWRGNFPQYNSIWYIYHIQRLT